MIGLLQWCSLTYLQSTLVSQSFNNSWPGCRVISITVAKTQRNLNPAKKPGREAGFDLAKEQFADARF
jgi:hypothetical protein